MVLDTMSRNLYSVLTDSLEIVENSAKLHNKDFSFFFFLVKVYILFKEKYLLENSFFLRGDGVFL